MKWPGAVDTTSCVLTWLFINLARNPENKKS